MIKGILNSVRSAFRFLSRLCLFALLSACADKAAVREADSERYRQLENEMISAQQADVQRRQAELRIAQRLQQMDAERSAAARQRLSDGADVAVPDSQSSTGSTEKNTPSPTVPAIVTQIVIAPSDTDTNADTWTQQYYPDPVDGTPLCALVSTPVVVMNGKLETRTRVIIGAQRVFLRTDATFDTDATDTGFRVDAGIPIAFDRFINELTAEVSDSYDRLLSAIEGGSSLAVSFAFMPQLSSAETHVIEFDLSYLESAMTDLASCESQNSATTIDATEDSVNS